MKTWSDSITLTQPLRDLRPPPPPGELAAREKLQQQIRESYDRGFCDGQRELGEQLLQQRAELLELQNGVLNSLRQTLPQVRNDCEASLVELALEVAHKLVAGLPISRKMVEAAIKEALRHAEEACDLTVWLHADDLKLLERANSSILSRAAHGGNTTFRASPEVPRGGCMVQTRFGWLDARRETKFELLKQSLEN